MVRPSIEIDEALREGCSSSGTSPRSISSAIPGGAEAIARLRHPSWACCRRQLRSASFRREPRAPDEYSLVAALQSWSVFEEVGSISRSPSCSGERCGDAAIAALVEHYRPRSDHWPGIILEVAEDQIVREAASLR